MNKTTKDETQDRGGFRQDQLGGLAVLAFGVGVVLNDQGDPGCLALDLDGVEGCIYQFDDEPVSRVYRAKIPCDRCAVVLAAELLGRFRT